MHYVLDACALLAFLRGEKGADRIETLLLDNKYSTTEKKPNTQLSAAPVGKKTLPVCSQPFKGDKMDFDEDKIDEFTLALLYLVSHERLEGLGARAWKGFDWDTLNRLHKKGYISNPVGKSKSVGMSEEGFIRAKELFERYFAEKI